MTGTEFSQEKFENPYPEGIEFHYWTIARHRIIFRRLQTILDAPNDLILDVGCGRGMAVQWLRERGLQAMGCDPGMPTPADSSVVPYLYLGVAAESLATELADRVRVILLLDVLEHLSEPALFLAGLFQSFGNCRRVLFTVPARQELWSNYDEYYGHKLRYDLPAVRRLAASAGCELYYAGYFFHSLWMPARLLRMMGKQRSTRIYPPGPAARAVHRLIASGFVLEEWIAPKSWVGTSILGVLHKNAGDK
jgi:SAM-dependent methyltransferase